MKKFLVAVMFGFMAIAAQAEATFDQVQTLIEQHQYQAAASGLEGIIQNHPKSAKAFYAMAQAQAGLGNLEKAQKALNIATGLNPTLDFAPASSVASLKQAITPQVAKIEVIEETHYMRNFVLFAMFAGFGVAMYFLYSVYARKQEQEEAELAKKLNEEAAARVAARDAQRKQEHMAMLAKQEEERKAEEALKAHKNYGHERFDPANPDKLKTVKQFKEEKASEELRLAQAQARTERLRAEAAEDEARRSRMTYSTPAPTVVNNNSGGNDMLTGVLIGNMLSGSNHHHDTERTVIRETVREVPAPSRSSTWDDTPAPSKSSSWDDTPSRSSSSSWSSSSDSSSSSSWDSGSSSSDSSSSSSWD